MSVWKRAILPKPLLHDTMRAAGFHWHLSFDDNGDTFETGEQFLLAFDLFVNLPSVIEEPYSERKKYYGQPSEFRIGKSYNGVEARSLSGFWINKAGIVWDRVMLSIDWVNKGNIIDTEKDIDIYNAILNNDKDLALKTINKYKNEYSNISW